MVAGPESLRWTRRLPARWFERYNRAALNLIFMVDKLSHWPFLLRALMQVIWPESAGVRRTSLSRVDGTAYPSCD